MNHIKAICGTVSAALAYLFGSLDTMLITLLVFIVIDFISGFIRAWLKKEFNSSKFYLGGVKKMGIILLIAVATQLDQLMMGDHAILRTAALSYYIACEGFSILENWGGLGLPLPHALKNALQKLKDNSGEDKKEDSNDD